MVLLMNFFSVIGVVEYRLVSYRVMFFVLGGNKKRKGYSGW